MKKKLNYVIVRADKAGVFFGQLESKEQNEVTLRNCRKLWYWDGANAIEQIAVDGINANKIKDCKFTIIVDSITIMGVNQILPCTDKAIECIINIPIWKQ